MNEELNKLVDSAIAGVDLQTLKIEEVVSDLAENAKVFAFRMLVSSRLVELAHAKQSEFKPEPEA